MVTQRTFQQGDDTMQRVPLIPPSDGRYLLKAGKDKVSQSKPKSCSIGARAISKRKIGLLETLINPVTALHCFENCQRISTL